MKINKNLVLDSQLGQASVGLQSADLVDAFFVKFAFKHACDTLQAGDVLAFSKTDVIASGMLTDVQNMTRFFSIDVAKDELEEMFELLRDQVDFSWMRDEAADAVFRILSGQPKPRRLQLSSANIPELSIAVVPYTVVSKRNAET